jgi:DNA repair exonuclease SbcCD ATPase subunit
MYPFYELWTNDLTSVLLLLLLIYAQVQYHLAAATAKIAKQTRALHENTLSAAEDNNSMLNQMRDELQGLTTRIESKENLEQRLQTLASAFKELLSAESALLTGKVATLKKGLVSGGFWGEKARQKLQKQMDDASQRNAVLERAATMV